MHAIAVPQDFVYEIVLGVAQHPRKYKPRTFALHPNSAIIALADVFASQIHPRTFKDSREPAEILKDFVHTILPVFSNSSSSYMSSFISFVTIYPPTSIIELNSGEVAIVTSSNPVNQHRPKIMMLLDKHKQKYNTVVEIDLADDSNKQITITGSYTQKMLEPFDIH